jgi:hypothetical protein
LGVRLIQGRLFTAADIQTALDYDTRMRQYWENNKRPPAELTNGAVYPCVINQSMARFFWPNQDPVGKMFSQGSDTGPWQQVIGVVNDVYQWSLTDRPIPEAYSPFDGDSRQLLVLHTSLPAASVTSEVRQALGQIDTALPLYSVRSMDQVVSSHAQGQQFLSALVGSFAGLAALLAAIGIYGVISYLVTQRTREIGIRISLGASRSRVLGEVLREGMRLAVFGVATGVAGAIAVGRVLASLLHEVKPGDPVIFAITAALLAASALAACYIPARRAAKLDPMVALRYE